MTSSAENTVESRNKLHSAIRAAAYLNKHSHALEESILRRTIVQDSEVKSSEPVAYCSSCDAQTVDKCLQLLTQLNSSELQIVVKKTAEVLTDNYTPQVATVPTAKTGFKPSPDYKRRPITNFSYAKMKKVVKGDMLQQENKAGRTLREAAFFNPKGSSKVGLKKPRRKKPQSESGDRLGRSVATTNQGVQTSQPQENPTIFNLPVPRVKLDSNGQIVVDPSSLVLPSPSHTQNPGSGGSKHHFKWPFADTVKFYEALFQHGTDFSLMMTNFTNRMRSNLKRKFISEDKKNRHLVDMVMKNGSTPSDLQEVIRQLKIQNDLKLKLKN